MLKRNAISILLADDHILFLDLWRSLLTNDPFFVVTGTASSGTDVVEMACEQKPDVILMDINMGPIDGFEATRMIRRNSPGSKIIGLSFSAVTAYAKKMKSLGAMGYLTKCCSLSEVKHAIVRVANGNFYYCELIRNMLKNEEALMTAADYNGSHLTERELKIIELIKEGLNSKDIAIQLGISANTVYNHRQNIYKKMQVSNATSLLNKMHLKGIY